MTWTSATISTVSGRNEIIWAILVAALPISAALSLGDALFLGGWYYAAVFGAALFLSVLLKPTPLFTLGATAALLTTFAAYWLVAISQPKIDGLLGLGHLCSLLGAAIGLLCGWLIVRRGLGYVAALGVGFGSVLIGFFANQLILCNTLMWCGPLSLLPP